MSRKQMGIQTVDSGVRNFINTTIYFLPMPFFINDLPKNTRHSLLMASQIREILNGKS